MTMKKKTDGYGKRCYYCDNWIYAEDYYEEFDGQISCPKCQKKFYAWLIACGVTAVSLIALMLFFVFCIGGK